MFIESALSSLDPWQQMISGFFGREYDLIKRSIYKGFKYLNRDTRKVIVIDNNFETVRKNKENVIILAIFLPKKKIKSLRHFHFD